MASGSFVAAEKMNLPPLIQPSNLNGDSSVN